jgi:hypothetical protein
MSQDLRGKFADASFVAAMRTNYMAAALKDARFGAALQQASLARALARAEN